MGTVAELEDFPMGGIARKIARKIGLMDKLETERCRMVEIQLVKSGFCEPRLLAAFESVPRPPLRAARLAGSSLRGHALPIAAGQTISQPYVVGLMTDLLALRGGEKVLEVGTGSGYQAAILGEAEPGACTRSNMTHVWRGRPKPGWRVWAVKTSVSGGDGAAGWPEAGPFDGILVTAGGPHVPPPLLGQLAEGGRLVMPVGVRGMQDLEVWNRRGEALNGETPPSGLCPAEGGTRLQE